MTQMWGQLDMVLGSFQGTVQFYTLKLKMEWFMVLYHSRIRDYLKEICLSLEEIDSLDDICEGFALLQKYEVTEKACQDLEDIKERLRLYYHKVHGQGHQLQTRLISAQRQTLRRNIRDHFRSSLVHGHGKDHYTTETPASDVIQALRESDEVKRMRLLELYGQIRETVSALDNQVIQHLVLEGTLKDSLSKDFENHKSDLQDGGCPILVTGETSSGKSSLLNLLLGREILPQSLLSCTSTIYKIKYGPELTVRVREVESSDWIETKWDKNEDCARYLAEHVVSHVDRELGKIQTKHVEIYIPLDILKTGVYIIDSPGFGEHPSIDTQIIDYISENEIFAFIYVIKTDNAGGVQEDRLQKILKIIVDKQETSHIGSFDPSAALFVCNRWDLVSSSEKTLVLHDIIKKLKHCWPDLKESQVLCLSTLKAWDTFNAGYITEDFGKLLLGLEKLLPVSLNRRLNHSYKWMEHFIGRSLHHVTSYLTKTRISFSELQARQKAADLRLHRVEREADVIMKGLDKQLDKFNRKIANALSAYLKTEEARNKTTCWQLQQLPLAKTDDSWVEVESEIDSVIENKLLDVLRDWDDKEKMFQEAQKELYYLFKKEFIVVESQLESIEHMIQCDDWSLSDKSDEEITRFIGLIDSVSMSEGLFDYNFNMLQKIALGVVAPILLPIAVGLLVGAPIIFAWDFKKWRKRVTAQHQLEAYRDDPVSFVHERSMKVMDKISDYDVVYEYVFNQMELARKYLDSMRLTIPKLVDANRQLLIAIMEDKRSRAELEHRYLSMEEVLPKLQDSLAAFGNQHVRKYDFEAQDVEIIRQENFMGKVVGMFGLWTEISKGKLASEETGVVYASVKSYRRKVSAKHLLHEENHFRKTKHPHIAKLLGVFEMEEGIPGLLLEPGLVKTRLELFGFKALPKSSRGRSSLMVRCRDILEQIGMGLEYLHYKGLVHLELTLDTVMMLANKDHVKLVNIGEPRRVDLPDSDKCETQDFVYLSPEIFAGKLYKARSDMYSLGLLCWELWHQERIFKSDRKLTLQEFIRKQKEDPVKVQLSESDNPLLGLIRGCIAAGEVRFTSTAFVNEVKKIQIGQQENEKDDLT